MQAVPACVQIGKDPVCLSFVAFSPFASFRGKFLLFYFSTAPILSLR